MIPYKVIKHTIVSKFKYFCKHSSLHGVYYFYNGTGCFVYVFWCVIIAISLGLCCFLSHMIWDKFVQDPTLIVVETTFYSVTKIPFPAVSVCDSEKVYPPNTQEITDLLTLRGFNTSEVQEFYRSFTDVEKKGYQVKPFLRKMHSLLHDLGYCFKILVDMFKRPCNRMITECSWRSRSHNCSQMFRAVYTAVGYCCQFDVPYFMQHVDVQTNFVSGVDHTDALNFAVHSQNKMYDNKTNRYPLLYVFDSQDKVTLLDNYITISPEIFFDVNVHVWAIDSSSYVKALSLDYRKCILDSDNHTGASFYQGCMNRLILQRVVTQCRCLPFEYTAEELGVAEYAACTWDRLVCIYETTGLVQADIKEIILQSECYQRCDYAQYKTEVEVIQNQRNLRNDSRSKVAVHFGQAICIKYRREVLYTWDQMLANLGGIFGLCLGGSIISIIEIIWFLFELLFSIVGIPWKKQVQPDKGEVFVITRKNTNTKDLPGNGQKYKFVN